MYVYIGWTRLFYYNINLPKYYYYKLIYGFYCVFIWALNYRRFEYFSEYMITGPTEMIDILSNTFR